MLRKLLLLVLFIGFVSLLFSLLTAGDHRFSASQANPSQKPLPQAWSSAGRAEVRLAGQPAVVAAETAGETAAENNAAGACPALVTVQRGDTLGAIAKRCEIALTDLLAANPSITNPNRIYPGQQLQVYGARGGGDLTAVTAAPPADGFRPGAEVIVAAEGFPPSARVKIGIGLPGAGFKTLGNYSAGEDGRLSVSLTIPASARAGERAFFLLSSAGVPSVQIISDAFVISPD